MWLVFKLNSQLGVGTGVEGKKPIMAARLSPSIRGVASVPFVEWSLSIRGGFAGEISSKKRWRAGSWSTPPPAYIPGAVLCCSVCVCVCVCVCVVRVGMGRRCRTVDAFASQMWWSLWWMVSVVPWAEILSQGRGTHLRLQDCTPTLVDSGFELEP
ncbi:hypothetical protein B0H66DRAFT_172398 [Apodospora peruviana]|uniref:Uncharacterized protein n=1 Tax=Apodospora peruviana TaxID=516989 RepID=A0AAE0HRX1_9PEZI|nr:hypothetical protein B0H66DRAFT_172398 [Apodospora peruviana]